MDGLKIDIAGVTRCGDEIKTSAGKIGELLKNLDSLVVQLGSSWKDEIYTQASADMRKSISDLEQLQGELVSLGTQIVDIASQYQTNKDTVKKMFGGTE